MKFIIFKKLISWKVIKNPMFSTLTFIGTDMARDQLKFFDPKN